MCSYIQLVQNLTSRDYADGLRAKIWDNSTHGTMYYGPTFYDRLTTSTAHLSVLGNDNIAVSVTTTVNLRYVSPLIRQKKCVFTVCRLTLIFGPALNFFMALLVENYLNTLFLPSNVVFDD